MRDLIWRVSCWYLGWKATLAIKFFQPELYRILKAEIINLDDFEEVEPPE